jgi:hypothetical protein
MAADHRQLNQLLIRLYRGLLPYVEECWPWSGGVHSIAERAAIDALALGRKRNVGKLVELLSARGWTIEFGNYPTEYTDLHYLGLDYLLGQLISEEEALVADLDRNVACFSDDAEAAALVSEIAAEERSNLAKLRELATKQKAA